MEYDEDEVELEVGTVARNREFYAQLEEEEKANAQVRQWFRPTMRNFRLFHAGVQIVERGRKGDEEKKEGRLTTVSPRFFPSFSPYAYDLTRFPQTERLEQAGAILLFSWNDL